MSLRPPPSQLPQRLAVGLAVGALLAATGCGARFDTNATAGGAAAGDQLSADQGATPADAGITDAGTTDAGTTDTRSAGTGADPGGLTDDGGTSTAPAAGGGTKASHAPKAQAAPASAGSQFGIEGKTVKICYLFAKSGSAPLPPNVEDAIDAYWDFVNTKKGGLNGFKVDPEVCDTQSTVAGAQAAVQKAIDIKAFAVTTLDRLALDAVMAERLWKAGIPNIALLNAPDPNPKWKDQTFFISTDQGVVGRMVAKYFQARKFKDVAVVSEASDANNEKVIKPFLQEAPKRGQKIVSDACGDLADDIRRGRRDHEQIGGISDIDVTDFRLLGEIERFTGHRLPGKRLKCQRCDKLHGPVGHDNLNPKTVLNQKPC